METIGFRGSITIDRGCVILRRNAQGEVWLAQPKIARLFGAFEAAVRANIRAIYRSEALRRGATQRIILGVELYNLEMIAALAFRLRGLESEAFRRWLLHPTEQRLLLVEFPGEAAFVNGRCLPVRRRRPCVLQGRFAAGSKMA